MKFSNKSKEIFTPQGRLADVEKDPNLDFLMNVFNIPRAFGVSGFGQPWNVGQHSYAVSLIALLWARFNRFDKAKRDAFVVQALLHDIHESVTGDVLPMHHAQEKTNTRARDGKSAEGSVVWLCKRKRGSEGENN